MMKKTNTKRVKKKRKHKKNNEGTREEEMKRGRQSQQLKKFKLEIPTTNAKSAQQNCYIPCV